MATQQPQTGIEITAKFFPLAFLLFFFPPTFVVYGQATRAKWREPLVFPVTPGPHTIRVFFTYLFLREAGRAEAQVDVPEGTTRRVGYKAPWLVFLRGKVVVS